jgi:hypothetical protein
MSVADFFDLRVTLKKMIDDELGTIRQQIDAINMIINDLELRVNLNRDEIVNLRNEFNIFQTDINNRFNILDTRVNNNTTDIDSLIIRMGNAETNINNLNTSVNNIQANITNLINRVASIEDQLPSFLKKVTPMPGYSPYNLGGGITAQVWMYDITIIDDNNIRFYYVQFNNIPYRPTPLFSTKINHLCMRIA